MTPDDDDLTPDPQTAADDAADDAHTERWREARARGREHDAMCPWNADHLAALERVRGETLREVRGAVGDRYDWQRNEFAPWGIKPLPDDQRFLDGIEDALAAIDRLIDATTTPLEES